jgi:transcriptional regulator with XRE-family HTH domain
MSDLTEREAAKELGVSLSTLSRIERGEAMDGVTLAKILAWLLGPIAR